MNNIFKLTLLSLCLPLALAQAADHSIVTNTSFAVSTASASESFEDTVLTTEGFLKRFDPSGVEIKRKVINGNAFEYLVVKKFLGIAKEVEMIGTMNFERTTNGCSNNETAYLGTIDLTGSQPIITDNIENFTLLLCLTEKSKNSLSVKVRSTLYYKGEKLGFIVEKFVTSVIKDQVEAIISAIKGEAQSVRKI